MVKTVRFDDNVIVFYIPKEMLKQDKERFRRRIQALEIIIAPVLLARIQLIKDT